MTFMHYRFSCPQMSFIIESYSLLFHKPFCPIFSVFFILRVEVACIRPVRRRSAKHFTMFARKIVSPWHSSPTCTGFTFLFQNADVLRQSLDLKIMYTNHINRYFQTSCQFRQWDSICRRLGCHCRDVVKVPLERVEHLVR